MENNEIMYEEGMENECTDIVEVDEGTGISTGAAIAIGSGLTLAIIGGVKLVKKGIAWIKAKKELHKVKDGEIVEVTDAQIAEVTSK